ncbi:hypothetical protein CKO43_20535 [Rubrivivax gelatinosus]|uniref:Uncharacterized protein n=2 Tax=Rubrivivax gelatinosus TaxID=28068 RepID=A0ABS1DZR3_RUBGE|nr:hypothetical protein [Rubrivivax gelatinosus]
MPASGTLAPMDSPRLRHLVLLPLLLAAPAVFAASDLDGRAERARIARERAAIESRYAAEQADCRARFVVTACSNEAKARRREALNQLKHQELVLDEQDRRRRAAARLDAIEARQREMAARPPVPVQPAPVIREAASVPADKPLALPSAAQRAAREREEAARAERRVDAAERQRQQAADDRARIAEREAERRAKGKAVAPLPPRPSIPAN